MPNIKPEDLFGKQKIDLTCPGCEHTFQVLASSVFKPGIKINCPKCESSIELDNNKAINDLKKQLRDLQKMFK